MDLLVFSVFFGHAAHVFIFSPFSAEKPSKAFTSGMLLGDSRE